MSKQNNYLFIHLSKTLVLYTLHNISLLNLRRLGKLLKLKTC